MRRRPVGQNEGAGPLRLLAIGTDADLAGPPGQAGGDAHQRQLKYASILTEYHMLVRTLGGHRFALRHEAGFTAHATASASRATFPLDAFQMGVRLEKGVGFDLLSTEDPMLCGFAGYLLKRRFGLPLSVQLAGDMIDNPYWLAERPINRVFNVLGKWVLRRTDTIRVVSTSELRKLVRLGLPAERIWNIGWMSDFSQFLRSDPGDSKVLRERLLPPPYTQLVLFVGRLVKQKDLPALLQAASQVHKERQDVRFVIVGGGPEEHRARGLAADLGLGTSVDFAGRVPHAQVPAYYAACDAFVLPSRYEGNARVLAEAGAAGKPVVTTDVSGARDTVIDGVNGYVVPIGRPAETAARLLSVLADPQQAGHMGLRARRRVLEIYADERLLAAFRELWQATAALRSSP